MTQFKIYETCSSTLTYIVEAKNKDEALEKHQENPDESLFMSQDYGNCDVDIEEDKE